MEDGGDLELVVGDDCVGRMNLRRLKGLGVTSKGQAADAIADVVND